MGTKSQVKNGRIKRGYNFPPEVIKAWEEFHSPSKHNYGPSAAAAFMVYMDLSAEARETLRKLDYKNQTMTTLRQIVRKVLSDEIKKWVEIRD